MAGLSDADHIETAVEDLREVLATVTAGDVAALIAEPIQGVGGFVHGAGRAARRAEEGAGRARHPAASPTRCRPAGAAPATTSGATRRTASMPGPDHVRQGHRQRVRARRRGGPGRRDRTRCRRSASPPSAATRSPPRPATRSLDYVLDHDLQANAARVGTILLRRPARGGRRSPIVAEVRGKGLMIGGGVRPARHDRAGPGGDGRGSSRSAGAAACWSARAACTATCCGWDRR